MIRTGRSGGFDPGRRSLVQPISDRKGLTAMSVPLLCAIHSARAGYEPTKGEQLSDRCRTNLGLADAGLRMERCNCIRLGETKLGRTRSNQTRPAASNTASRVRTDRTLEVFFTTTDYCSNQMTAFCRCTACIVVIDAKKI